jgi:hypothetical protein
MQAGHRLAVYHQRAPGENNAKQRHERADQHREHARPKAMHIADAIAAGDDNEEHSDGYEEKPGPEVFWCSYVHETL